MNIVKKIFPPRNERELRRLWPIVDRINSLEPEFKKLDDHALQQKTAEFKSRLEAGETLDDLLPEAFATVREAAVRTLRMRHFDVQLIGGAVLHQGKIAEMKTGEGKTLTATLPVYLNALTGKGVHVVTVNDYLARRDAEWMSQIYSFLGLTTGIVLSGLDPDARQEAYNADITYGQNNEFGFDYLRDNMKLDISEKAQRSHQFAIVDEVDSILVDESRTPLIISGPSEKPAETYLLADEIVRKLKPEVDFAVDLKRKTPTLTEDGILHIEQMQRLENLYDPQNTELVHHINQALKAHATMKNDVDYVVRDGQIVIVDEFTGRLMAGRRWSDGLHQAVEAKERVKIQRESVTLATITFQNYFRMYKKLAGMTGTADTEAVEFKKIYSLEVVMIPTNEPMVRRDWPDVVYSTERGKFNAVIDEITEHHKRGQPVLVGTASIYKSELLSGLLRQRGVPHEVLNAKYHEREAGIVAQAGRIGAVTISTNMAGRGTDILLGGNAEFLAREEFGAAEPDNPEYIAAVAHYREQCSKERAEVLEKGGLHILGTERHESRRIDNQLRGRAGRQGDPGSSRFYISLEDDLMRRFGGERIQAIMTRVGLREEDAIEGRLVARAIENAQRKVEGHHFDMRKHLLEYDDVLNKQREVVYSLRERILRQEGMQDLITEIVGDTLEEIILTRADEKLPVEEWEVEGIVKEVSRVFFMPIDPKPFVEQQERATKELAQTMFDALREQVLGHYESRKQQFGVEQMEYFERVQYLRAIDFFWKEHLTNMDHLKDGINLRGYGQRNPLHEYQREAFTLFNSMMASARLALLQDLFSVRILTEEEVRQLEEMEKERQRQREAAAKEIHAGDPEPEEETPTTGSGNREQRRQEQKDAKKGKRKHR